MAKTIHWRRTILTNLDSADWNAFFEPCRTPLQQIFTKMYNVCRSTAYELTSKKFCSHLFNSRTAESPGPSVNTAEIESYSKAIFPFVFVLNIQPSIESLLSIFFVLRPLLGWPLPLICAPLCPTRPRPPRSICRTYIGSVDDNSRTVAVFNLVPESIGAQGTFIAQWIE